ncbi:tetratricopeptide repeat protein [Roseovarius sp. PS-C2]|uniref:tetratricopeptide repeat protein n=1 Tax=Roseovarius sp. PS-C2 TaxID=2820814 RepID=UPI001C0B7F22|nr:tetratricopeptide repeat protein [Roseovarius sp. PS-C2]MBU3261821.1 tetratricopeptide repeat protein [Roseovarius sp. PS-C2]
MHPFGFLRCLRLIAALFVAITLLAACDSAEERAEAHFQAGMALLEEGDVDRALIEFRNVFKLNGQHKEARLTFARLQRERGNISGAYGQYLRLIEQYPDNLEGRRALAEMALETGQWDEVERHGAAAARLAPEDLRIQSINNALAYSNAISQNDIAAIDDTLDTARALIHADPEIVTARQVLIDHLVRNRDWHDAIEEIDATLAIDPEIDSLYAIRLGALKELDRPADIEAQLRQMAERFPDDEGVKQMLVQTLIDHRNLDAAEQFLRAEVAQNSEDHMIVQRLIVFLDQYRSASEAISEVDRIIAQGGANTARYKALRAVLKFRAGEVQTAIDEMDALLRDAERTIETREIEVEFARLLFQADDPVRARALIEAVLEEDPTQVDALKFKAAWLIDEDGTGEAIVLLREALSQTPRDPQLMTLMARAHERNGNQELMGEMLALAVETSQRAPQESLRYARYLSARGDLKIAESVLLDALRLAPDSAELLMALGKLYLQMEDWGRLEAVIRTIDDLDGPETVGMANQLRAEMLTAQRRTDDLKSFLSELANNPDFKLPAEIALVRTMLAQQNIGGALARLDLLLEETPDSLPLRYVKALSLAADQKNEEAEVLYRSILDDHPEATDVWISLYALLIDTNAPEQAAQVLNDALDAQPESFKLLMIRAANYELDGEIEMAISVYEKLYELNSQSPVVANNLASLLTTHRSDDESLQRAFTLARRLRGTRDPIFQDTYGWIAYRLGNYEEALQYLEPAAAKLPDQPLVLYHLAKTYVALDRHEDALRTFENAVSVVEGLDDQPNFTSELLSEIERLQTEPARKE